jgi:hypothetical protein
MYDLEGIVCFRAPSERYLRYLNDFCDIIRRCITCLSCERKIETSHEVRNCSTKKVAMFSCQHLYVRMRACLGLQNDTDASHTHAAR